MAVAILFLLIGIRFVEMTYFNDGLILFFHHDYVSKALPFVPVNVILLTDTLRYLLNSLLSILLLWLFFREKNLLKLLILIYIVFYLIAIVLFYYQLTHYQAGEYLGLFYVRRFLIQPILLFLLFPALLYQRVQKKS